MAEFSPKHLTELMFAKLFENLLSCWPASSVSYIADMADHGEYGEALENLAALSRREGHPLDIEALRLVTDIGDAIEIDAADLLGGTLPHNSGAGAQAV